MRRIVLVPTLTFLLACGSDATEPPGGGGALFGVLRVSASSEVSRVLLGAPAPEAHYEDRLLVHVDLENTADSLLHTGLNPCDLELTLTPASGAVEVIPNPDVNRSCSDGGAELILGAGRVSRVTLSVLSGAFLERGDESREYAVEVLLPSGGDTEALGAGSVTIAPPGRDATSGLDSVFVSGSVQVVERSLEGVVLSSVQVTAVTVNLGSWPVRVAFGDCSIRSTAHRTADPEAPPLWYSERQEDWGSGVSFGCTARLNLAFLASGDTLSLNSFYDVQNILGDSLESGEYHFRGVVGLDDVELPVDFGATPVPATWLPYPPRRNLDGYGYQIETEVVDETPTRVSATLTVRNVVTLDLTRFLLADCPFVFTAFADSLDVGRVPPVEPIWRSHDRDCSGREAVSLAPGEERSFTFSFGADQVLAGGRPEGRYFFGALVEVHADREDAPRQRLRFSGGSALLRR